MYEILIKTYFDAAHFLPDYDGKCSHLHGHRWTVEVAYVFEDIGKDGFCIDFSVLKKELSLILPDHALLNDYIINPTAENISIWLANRVLDFNNVYSVKVRVWESPTAYAEFERGEKDARP